MKIISFVADVTTKTTKRHGNAVHGANTSLWLLCRQFCCLLLLSWLCSGSSTTRAATASKTKANCSTSTPHWWLPVTSHCLDSVSHSSGLYSRTIHRAFDFTAVLLYRICRCCSHLVVKLCHVFFHACSIPCIVIGALAVWQWKNEFNHVHFYSLHSWLGFITFGLFVFQFVLGFFRWDLVTQLLELSKLRKASTISLQKLKTVIQPIEGFKAKCLELSKRTLLFIDCFE